MNTIMKAVGSKKLMLAGVVLGLMVEDAMSQGWSAAHLFAVAIVTCGYCVGQGIVDALGVREKFGNVTMTESMNVVTESKPDPPA